MDKIRSFQWRHGAHLHDNYHGHASIDLISLEDSAKFWFLLKNSMLLLVCILQNIDKSDAIQINIDQSVEGI
jgi:hypothetical protein